MLNRFEPASRSSEDASSVASGHCAESGVKAPSFDDAVCSAGELQDPALMIPGGRNVPNAELARLTYSLGNPKSTSLKTTWNGVPSATLASSQSVRFLCRVEMLEAPRARASEPHFSFVVEPLLREGVRKLRHISCNVSEKIAPAI